MSEVITDAAGRSITLRTLTVYDQVKLLRAIGAQHSNNQPYVAIVNMCAMVSDIDGTPLPFPKSEAQIDANIMKIGDAGFAALTVKVEAETRALMEAAEAAADQAGRPDPSQPSGK